MSSSEQTYSIIDNRSVFENDPSRNQCDCFYLASMLTDELALGSFF